MRAAIRQEAPSDAEGMYESFSDMVLCTVIVLITLVVVLALNVVEQLIESNHFSGGATRPWLYIQAQNTDYTKTTSNDLALERAVYGSRPFVMVNLFSPSAALSATTVKDGETISAKAGQSISGQCDLTAYGFMLMAAGITPGSFPVAGKPTALMLPKFSHKQVLLEASSNNSYSTQPENELALKTMATAWPVYNNELYPRRAAADYREARTKIYVEVLDLDDEAHRILIGHSVFTLPQDIENGRLGWLAGFSSGLTEVVYLGKAWSNSTKQTNKRIHFFEKNGFPAAATAYRSFSFPEGVTPTQSKLLEKAASARPEMNQDQLQLYVREAEAQQAISAAIVDGSNPHEFLPPLLVYRQAWQAYIEDCTANEMGHTPPQWLMEEFLEPLGFTQAIIKDREEVL